ncbi:MAG: hypothetical protein L3K03_09690, partial [Thermoplasmata archaeon]|nr:hypothetical protein [Thermoplasmata archaeon]
MTAEQINASLAQLAATGGTYTLTGDVALDQPIVIPYGSKKVTFDGGGHKLTCSSAWKSSYRAMMEIGFQGITQTFPFSQNQQEISPVAKGAITLPAKLSDGYYWLYDMYLCTTLTTPPATVANHGEIVQIEDGAPNNAIGRDYGADGSRVYIAGVDKWLCEQITVQNLGFDGASSPQDAQSFIFAALVDELTLTELSGANHYNSGFAIKACWDVYIVNSETTGGQQAQGSYGFECDLSNAVDYVGCTSDGAQHAFYCGAGSFKVTYSSCTAGGGGFDCHGQGEFSVTYIACKGPISLGNQAWPDGTSVVTTIDCDFGPVTFSYGLNGLTDSDSTWTALQTFPTAHNGAVLAPTGLQFSKSIITDKTYLTPDAVAAGTWVLNGCTLTTTQAAWGDVIRFASMA